MSFILEALRKSESDRQRLGSVAMADLPIARRQHSQPWWVFALSGLLLVNLIVLGIVLFRDTTTPSYELTAPTNQPAPAPIAATAIAPEPQRVTERVPAPVATGNELEEAATQFDYETVPRSELEIANAAASIPDGPTLVRPTEALRGDATAGMSTEERDDANTRASQELRVDLHVYSKKASERFVLINMRRYTEGQQLPNGAMVEQITVDGVVLYQNGTRYRLDRK